MIYFVNDFHTALEDNKKYSILYIVHIVCENVQSLKLEWATKGS